MSKKLRGSRLDLATLASLHGWQDHARLQGHLQLCADPSYTAVSLVKKAVMGARGWDDAGWNDGTMELGAGSFTGVAQVTQGRSLGWQGLFCNAGWASHGHWLHYVEILFPYILMSQEI